MEERVSRRGLFRKLLADSVNGIGRVLSDVVYPSGSPGSDGILTPEEAGHLLRSRKTTPKGIRIDPIYFDRPRRKSKFNKS